jgi:hypothetical protein
LIDGALFRKNYDNMFLRCLEKPDADKVLANFMMDQPEDILVEKQLPTRFLRVGYYWPTLF